MKRLLFSLSVVLFLSVSAFADEPQKFSPEKFQAEMEQFITRNSPLRNSRQRWSSLSLRRPV